MAFFTVQEFLKHTLRNYNKGGGGGGGSGVLRQNFYYENRYNIVQF